MLNGLQCNATMYRVDGEPISHACVKADIAESVVVGQRQLHKFFVCCVHGV